MPQPPRPVSIIIPAHNESRSLPGLLQVLIPDGAPSWLDVVVVCNGCTDDTADRARAFAGVRVLEIVEASKRAALAEGNRNARHGCRGYVDADVLVSHEDLVRLVADLADPRILAVAPERRLDRHRVAPLVSWYYDVWERLPQVRSGLFGRGVIVLSEAGHGRVSSIREVMSDDLMMSEAFTSDERRVVVGAEVVIRLPRTLTDLLRRRTRVATGNTEIDREGLRAAESRTSVKTLGRLVAERPWSAPKVAVFVLVTVVARFRASRQVRRGDFQTWLRDESSRQL